MALGLISAGIGALGGIAQTISGSRRAREAREELENYQRQELGSVTNDLSVYTKGAEMQTQESARFGASAVDALSRSGTRGLVGGLGGLQMNQQLQQRQIGADLERQQARIDQMRVQDAMQVRQMQERREEMDIQALSSQYNAGQQMMWSGIGSIAQAGMSGLQMAQEADLKNKELGLGRYDNRVREQLPINTLDSFGIIR